MKKAPASKSSIPLAEMPRWVKDRTAAKSTALKNKGNHGKVPTKTQSMTDLKKSASASRFGGKLEKDGEYDKMDYNNLPARWFDQDKKVEIRKKAKAYSRNPQRGLIQKTYQPQNVKGILVRVQKTVMLG